MNDVGGEFYSSDQSPSTPVPVSSQGKDPNARLHGDMLKMMNPTPNGYSSVSQDAVHHENKIKHSSDHVKKKEHDESKHKISSHSKPHDSSKDSSKKEGHEGHKEKKHKSSHKEHKDISKESSHKHSDSSKHGFDKKEEKHKSDSSSKELANSGEKPKNDNFKENEKVKDSSSKEHKEKHKEHKEKHKDKHRDKEHKDKHKDKSKSSGDKPSEKTDKPKEKSEKPKDESSEKKEKEKNSEKHRDKHSDKHKDKHSDKHKEKHKDKQHKEKSKEKQELKALGNSAVKSSNNERPLEKVIKQELESQENLLDLGLVSARKASINASKSIKREAEDSDDEPLSDKMEKKVKSEKKKKKPASDDDDYEMEEEKPKKKRKTDSDDDDYGSQKPVKKVKKEVKQEVKKEVKKKPKVKVEPPSQISSPVKRKKKEEEEQDVWKWWEEEKLDGGQKWRTLQHNGPVFAPPYERVPKNVRLYYEGKPLELSELTEEVAGFYGRMLDHEYTSKEVFNTNFFKDWRKVMTPKEREIIKDLSKCNFKEFDDYYKMKTEERKSMTKEEKLAIKKENEELTAKYGFCIIDGHKQKIGNFKIEPPGLFRGRGEHPKMGMLKRRIEAEDISINIGKEAKAPPPPPGHKWKDVRHDNTVSWLASWTENILGSTKYIMLNPSSKLKGEKDWQKYETARKLKAHADRIREEYTQDFKSKEMKIRQRAVALYFIDRLALRAGNEKDEDTADTVGCCSLRVEHITLDDEKDGKEYVVSFDFLGKDSIRYYNSVPVDKKVYKNLKLFMENKQPGDDLFDRLNTTILNKYLNDLMDGLTAKVFRTYNASKTLQEQLDLLTEESMSIPEKVLAYNRANRAVAILCNHQRAVPKTFSKSMENLKQKIDEKHAQIKDFKKELKQAKQAAKDGGSKEKQNYDKKKKRLAQLEEQLQKLEVQATDKEENKQIALGTSKLNYLDPRISVAWCKKWNVPIEKVYNRTQRDKFRWAIEMAGPDYKF